MKKMSFTVNVSFSEKINSDEEIKEIAQGIAEAIQSHVDTAGLAPEMSDAFTTEIEVIPQDLPEAKIIVTF